MQIAAFFEGGIGYSELRSMPLDEVSIINDEAKKIEKARRKNNG